MLKLYGNIFNIIKDILKYSNEIQKRKKKDSKKVTPTNEFTRIIDNRIFPNIYSTNQITNVKREKI